YADLESFNAHQIGGLQTRKDLGNRLDMGGPEELSHHICRNTRAACDKSQGRPARTTQSVRHKWLGGQAPGTSLPATTLSGAGAPRLGTAEARSSEPSDSDGVVWRGPRMRSNAD